MIVSQIQEEEEERRGFGYERVSTKQNENEGFNKKGESVRKLKKWP